MPSDDPTSPPDGTVAYARRWSQLHHDIDPAGIPVVLPWLRLMWRGGAALSRAGVPPTAVTLAGVVAAAGAVRAAPRHPGVGAAAVVAAALCDGLDGATAVTGDRATRSGAVADAVADRVCDGLFAAVLARRGAPRWLAGAAAGSAWAVDTLRRVRRVPDRVTVAERPTFTVCAALACASAGFTRGRWSPTLCAVVWVGAGAIGLGQILATPPGEPG